MASFAYWSVHEEKVSKQDMTTLTRILLRLHVFYSRK